MEHLQSRFETDDLRRPIAADNAGDDKFVETAIAHHDLERWFGVVRELAQKAADADTEDHSAKDVFFRAFADSFADPEIENINLQVEAFITDAADRQAVEQVIVDETEEETERDEEEDGDGDGEDDEEEDDTEVEQDENQDPEDETDEDVEMED